MADERTFDDRDGFIWFDGELKPWREANVHVLTHALHYASSVFEGQRAYGGTIFKLHEHSERLRRSAELLGMPTIVTVGRGLEGGTIELRDRATDAREEVPVAEAAARVLAAARG